MSGLAIVRVTPHVANGGYVASYHGLLRGHVQVDAPCGCVLIVSPRADSVLTPCNHSGCQFEWHPAVEAIGQLEAIEESRREQIRRSREEAVQGPKES